MADRCMVPKVDIKPGFSMLPPLFRPADEVNASFDRIFHYIDGNYKLRVHHFLLKSIVENNLFTEIDEDENSV